MLTDNGRTTGGRRTDDGYLHILYPHLWAFGSGELKMQGIHKKCHFKDKIGELIGYSWSSVQPSVHPQCTKIFSSKTAWPIKAKFYVEPPWVGGTKVCSRHLGHMTKMAAMPIYGKNPSKIFSRTGGPISTKLGV